MITGKEPTIIIQSLVTALNAVQFLTISAPGWAHVVILLVIGALGGLTNRSVVTPAP